jgi:hypothetical protein
MREEGVVHVDAVLAVKVFDAQPTFRVDHDARVATRNQHVVEHDITLRRTTDDE